MSKKQIDLQKLNSLKKLKPKKEESIIDTEQAVKSIHEKNRAENIEKEKAKRVTIDLPFSLYVAIRNKTVQQEKTLKDYFVELAESDLKG